MSEQICTSCKKPGKFYKGRSKCAACREMDRKLSTGELRSPEFAEVNVTNYKEPMIKVEDGFGYYGAITQTNDGLHIQCHICGYYVGRLGSHVANKHKIRPREYNEKYGLRLTEGLLSPAAKWAAQTVYNRRVRKSPAEHKAWGERMKAARAASAHKAGGDQWSAQTRNEKGHCKDQTLAKLRRVAEMNGGVITQRAYIREYSNTDVVLHWFGTWSEAVKAAGAQLHYDKLREKRSEDVVRILKGIQIFYEETGRTPQTADFDSSDHLPGQSRVTKLFGSLNTARMAAGVPTLVYAGRDWVEIPPANINGNIPSYARNNA